MNTSFESILEYINTLEIVDTHEHLPHREDARNMEADVLQDYLIHYFCCDLVSAGLTPENLSRVHQTGLSIMEKWDILEPYWEHARHTGYGRSLDITVKGLYGIDGITRDTIEQLEQRFQESKKPGHYHYVLKEKSQILVSILDYNLDCDRTYFRSVYNMDYFIMPTTNEDLKQIESMGDTRICSFDDWLTACERTMDEVFKQGAVGLKSPLAYKRSLHYERATRSEAEKEFNDFWDQKHVIRWENRLPVTGSHFQNYMMHFILNLANKRNVTYQFHTGLQEGIGNIVQHSNPTHLSNLFEAYPDVRFDLFHMGYPFQQTLSALAKNFQNVFIDMCWGHIISPKASIDALDEWLDAVPVNKIMAFGGDYCFIDAVYGHQYLARQNVARSLANKVTQSVFDLDRAKEIARMLFVDNPVSLFHLTDI